MVSFNVTKKQEDLISLIAERAMKGLFAGHAKQDLLAITMDLSATIAQGCDLDLKNCWPSTTSISTTMLVASTCTSTAPPACWKTASCQGARDENLYRRSDRNRVR